MENRKVAVTFAMTCLLLRSAFKTVQAEGQLISKRLFGAIVLTKIPTKFFPGFLSALASKKMSNQKNKGTLLH